MVTTNFRFRSTAGYLRRETSDRRTLLSERLTDRVRLFRGVMAQLKGETFRTRFARCRETCLRELGRVSGLFGRSAIGAYAIRALEGDQLQLRACQPVALRSSGGDAPAGAQAQNLGRLAAPPRRGVALLMSRLAK